MLLTNYEEGVNSMGESVCFAKPLWDLGIELLSLHRDGKLDVRFRSVKYPSQNQWAPKYHDYYEYIFRESECSFRWEQSDLRCPRTEKQLYPVMSPSNLFDTFFRIIIQTHGSTRIKQHPIGELFANKKRLEIFYDLGQVFRKLPYQKMNNILHLDYKQFTQVCKNIDPNIRISNLAWGKKWWQKGNENDCKFHDCDYPEFQ